MNRVNRAKYLLGAIVLDSNFSKEGKKPVKKTVSGKGVKPHTQTFWVKDNPDFGAFSGSKLLASIPERPKSIPLKPNPRLGAIAFKTKQGSIYLAGSDDRNNACTMRYKVPHQGHSKDDVGWKEKSEVTLYLNNPLTAREIGMWQTSSAEGKRVLVDMKNKQILLVSMNPVHQKLGKYTFVSGDSSFSLIPSIGSSPLELWKYDDSIQVGEYRAFRGSHPGNEIVEIEEPETNQRSSP